MMGSGNKNDLGTGRFCLSEKVSIRSTSKRISGYNGFILILISSAKQKGSEDMSTQLYNLGKLIAELKEYQESGAVLLGEDAVKRCLIASRHPSPADKSVECTHELITLHAGTCERCGAFFVRPLKRRTNQEL